MNIAPLLRFAGSSRRPSALRVFAADRRGYLGVFGFLVLELVGKRKRGKKDKGRGRNE